MLVSNKHFTPVIGLDIHIVILFGFPIPLPHPYIGFVIDPMDYIPFLGATTKINHVPRGKSDTSGIFIILFHIPMGGPFLLAPMIGHDSVNFFGSKRVKVEGNMMSPAGHLLMTCNDIGIPLSLQPGKKFKPIPSMYLPTSFSIPLSFGKPVMIGGPFVPDWAGALLNLVMSFGFGALLKGMGKGAKRMKKAITEFNLARQKRIGGSDKLSKTLCFLGFEPVDLVQGIVIYDGVDFELPGPIPLTWARSWNSDSTHHGVLGHGVHWAYDMRLLDITAEGCMVLLLGDGRSVNFYEAYVKSAQLSLSRIDENTWQVFDAKDRLYYDFYKLDEKEYRLQAVRNESHFMISFHYNSKGHLLRVIDCVDRQLHIRNDAEGRILRVTVHHRYEQKELVRYEYNERGDLVTIVDALNQATRIQYTEHKMVAKTDRNGQSFYWAYDDKGRCVHTYGEGGILEGRIAYYPGYNLVTNAQGQVTTYYYTPEHLVTQIKDALGNSHFMEYTDDAQLYREIDEEGNVTGYTYDEKGYRTSKVMADGSTFRFAYNEAGQLILAADAQGNSRVCTYYENGLPHTITAADGSINIFRYNSSHLLSAVSDAQDNTIRMTYDEDTNLVSMLHPDGSEASWQYDVWGNCVMVSNPLKQQQHFQYDALDRVVGIREPDGNYIQLQYNAYDKVVQSSDHQHVVKYAYTAMGSLKMREQHGSKQHYLYNKDEQLTTVVNERGEMYKLVRNGRGDIVRETAFDGYTQEYTRDSTGKIIKITKPGKQWVTFEYDSKGNMTRADYSDGCWELYNYNSNGQLIHALNQHSTLQFERDRTGRIVQEWQDGHIVQSQYSQHGRRVKVQSSLGADITTGYGADGSVSSIQTDVWETHILRNSVGLEVERTLPGGIKSSWLYNSAGLHATHVVQQEHREQRRRSYRWDVNQQLKQITIHGVGNIHFNHDHLGQLAWAQYEQGQSDYKMPDKAGNVYRSKERNDRQYAAGGRLMETQAVQYQYDDAGNLVSASDHWQYKWYGNGMLKQVIRPDGQAINYKYDALGRRIEQQYKGVQTRYIWDGNVLLHEWRNEQSLITWIFEEGTYCPVAKLVNGQAYSIITDHLGTPCEAYDQRGEKVWSCELDIFGKVRKFAGDKAFIPFRYQGQYEDAETGMYYNRFRYYHPEMGTFISVDPLSIDGGLNVYAYVRDTNVELDVWGLVPGPKPSPWVERISKKRPLAPGKNFSMQGSEGPFTKQVLDKKSNYRVYRVDQTAFAGDFILVDMSNPKAMKGFVLDVKDNSKLVIGGGGAGNQFTRAAAVLQSMGLTDSNFERLSGDSQYIMDHLQKGCP